MKILALGAYYYPEKAASLYLSENLYEEMVKENCKVVLFTPMPSRNVSEKARASFEKKKIEYKYNDSLVIVRIALFKESKGTSIRFIRYLIMTFKYLIKALPLRVDLVFAQSTPPILGFMIAFLKMIKKIPFVYSLQDVFPDSMVHIGLCKENSLIWKIGRVIENYTYKNADKIIVISKDCKKNLLRKKVPEDKIEVIYNWVDETAIIPVERSNNSLFEKFNLSKDLFYVVYAGNLGKAQNIEVILKAAKKLENYKCIKFVIIGEGQEEVFYKEMASSLKLENLVFFPLQPYETVSEVYSLGDVSIVSCKRGHSGSAMPSKTWSIMSTGTPVIASFDEGTDMQSIIEDNNVGLFTKAGNSEALKDAILLLYENGDLGKEMGMNGRKYVEVNLTRKIGTEKYLSIFRYFGNPG